MVGKRSNCSAAILLLIGGQVLDAAPVPLSREINTRSPHLHHLDPKRISDAERRPWHPAKLVAILGSQRARHWQSLSGVSYSPDGKQIASNAHAYIYLPGYVYLWDAPHLRFRALLPITATFMQFVRERNRLFTCGTDGLVQIWDVSRDTPRSRVILRDVPITWHDGLGAFSQVALSPDSKKLVVATGTGFTYYDLSASPPKSRSVSLGEGRTLLKAAFSPDSRSLVTLKGEVGPLSGYVGRSLIRNQEVTLWDVSGAEPKARAALKGASWWWGKITFSPDGKTVISGANIWDLSGERPKFRGTLNADSQSSQGGVSRSDGQRRKADDRPRKVDDVQNCLFLPGNQYAITTGYSWNELNSHPYLRVRDLRERVPRILQSVTPTHPFSTYQSMALSPDAKHLAVGEGHCLHVWEVNKERIKVLPPSPGHTQDVKAMSFGACGNLLATIARDGTLRLWDLDGAQPHERLVQKQKFGHSWDTVAVSPDGTKVAAGFQGGCRGFTLWEISPSGLRLLAEHERGGQFLRFSPDSKILFASDGSGPHTIIDLSKPKEILPNQRLGWRGGHRFAIEALALSPDGQTLAVGGNYELELWKRTGSNWEKRPNYRAECDVKSMSFAGHGRKLLIGGGSYKKPEVHLYDLSGESPKPIAAFSGLRDVALSVSASSTGKLFAACDETGRVIVWSASGKKLHEWTFPGPVHCVAFAPDGYHLALGNGDGTVYILRLAVPTQE